MSSDISLTTVRKNASYFLTPVAMATEIISKQQSNVKNDAKVNLTTSKRTPGCLPSVKRECSKGIAFRQTVRNYATFTTSTTKAASSLHSSEARATETTSELGSSVKRGAYIHPTGSALSLQKEVSAGRTLQDTSGTRNTEVAKHLVTLVVQATPIISEPKKNARHSARAKVLTSNSGRKSGMPCSPG